MTTVSTIGNQKLVASPSQYVRWLEDMTQKSLPEAGGKGANLGELIHAGLPVPPGFVVTADAYRLHLESANLPDRIAARLRNLASQEVAAVTAASEDIMGWILAAPMPDSIRENVADSYHMLMDREIVRKNGSVSLPVAVRSSATAEDLPSASFAGQQETYLNIREAEAVNNAVRKCWASLWTSQAISYRASMNFDHLSVSLAVVVQAMVPADVAGVMFTVNPVSGARDEILISGSYGLGETVVSGAVTPDTFILSPDGKVKQRTLGTKEIRIVPDGNGTRTETVPAADQRRYCLTDSDLAALAELARRVQTHYGSPQDTEWALSSGNLYLLQARPITTLNRVQSEPLFPLDEAPINRKVFGAGQLFEYWPEPTTPLDISFFCESATGGAKLYELFGLRLPTEPTEPVERPDGRIAVRVGNPHMSPAMLWTIPRRLLFTRGDPLKRWQVVVDEFNATLKGWQSAESAAIAAHDAPALARLVSKEMPEFGHLLGRRFEAVFFSGIHYAIMVNLWARIVAGNKGSSALNDRLMRAVPFRTALQNQAVGRLVQVAKAHGEDSREYSAALAEFMVEWGSRPARGMVSMPSIPAWREAPEVVNGLVDALISDTSATPEESLRQEEADFLTARTQVESALWAPLRRTFRRHLDLARNGLIAREDSLYRMEIMIAAIRQTALRLGEQLVSQGILSARDDVLYLLNNELLPVAEGKLDVAERIAHRRQAFARVAAASERGQHWLIATGSISAPKVKAKKSKRGGKQSADDHALSGLAAAAGIATGPVCIIRGPHEFGKMRKGDVLVAPFTAPVWTPLFRLASAVVTEVGSPTAHAAIVAREYGIPAVVAVPQATTLLHDGQSVRVDGAAGAVSILDAARK